MARPPSRDASAYNAKNLNPVEDSTPILAKDFSGQTISFTPEEIDAAIRAEMARLGRDTSSLKDTILEFNLVAAAGDREAFVGGFKYRRLGLQAGFARAEGNGVSPFGGLHGTFDLPKAILNYSGRIGKTGALLGIDYIFIAGSPYHSRIGTDSTFTVPHMSPGIYGLVGADQDSSKLFESSDSLSTDDSAYVAKAWDVITFIPGP